MKHVIRGKRNREAHRRFHPVSDWLLRGLVLQASSPSEVF
jgi:hypothetical protein